MNPTQDNDPAEPWVWQRLTVSLPASLQTPQQLGLLLEDEDCFYQVYVNGHFVGARGDIDRNRGPFASRAIFSFPSTLAHDGRLTIAIHASRSVVNEPTGLVSTLGPIQAVRAKFESNTLEYLQKQWQHYLCFFLVFCIGIFFGLLFLLDRASKENLWLAVILCGISLARFAFLASTVDIGLSSLVANTSFFTLQCLVSISVVQFSFSLIQEPVSLVFRIFQFASACWLLAVPVYLPSPYSAQVAFARMDHVVSPLTLVASLLCDASLLLPLPSCFRSSRPEMRWIGAALIFLTFEEINRYGGELSALAFSSTFAVPQHFQLGHLDFDLRALAYLLFAIVMLVAMSVRFQRIQSRNLQMQADLEAARTVQNLLIPSHLPLTPGFSVQSVYLPAQEVGGDFYYVAPADDGSLLLIMGDVSGKGLSSAMTVSAIIGALRADLTRQPELVLAHLNQALFGLISGFVTCCVAHLNPGYTLTLANAGHLSPYLNGAELSLPSALPLGLTGDVDYISRSFTLQPGDHLTFVSDGVVEASNHTGELFGFGRTAVASTQPASSIAENAKSFAEGGPQADDITVLTVDCDEN